MRPLVRVGGLLASLLLALLAGVVAADARDTAYPGRNGAILYIRDLGGNAPKGGHIFVSAADGSGLHDLTPAGITDVRSAAWSPDGRRIAFSGSGPARLTPAVFVMNADGGGLRQVTRGHLAESSPTWSPDGKNVAFSSFDSGLRQIFRSRLDGTGRRVLSNQTTNCQNAEWSPTGGVIVFECQLAGGLVIMRADGSGERRLTTAARTTDSSPAWAPDGRTIVFSRGTWTYSVGPDGRGLRRIARIVGDRAISPDGRWLAMTRFVDEQQELWVLRRDGTGARRLTATSGVLEFAPDWQPVR
jgi:Tol biopolymer transport system component